MQHRIIKLAIFLLLFQPSFAQDSLNMERVGMWNPPNMPVFGGVTFNDVWGYTASDGSEYGIIGNVDSIMVIDVTNPATPVREYGYDGGNSAIWRDFKVHNDHLYAVCDGCSEGLHIFDLSALPNGDVSHVTTTTQFFSRAHNIFIDTLSQRLYAAGTNTVSEGLVVLDISVPGQPTLLANVEFEPGSPDNYYVHDLYVQNDTAYCSHGNLGYYVWDMINLASVVNLGSYDSPGYNHSSWNHSSGQYAYYAEEVPLGRPMAVMDLSNLGSTTADILLVTTFKDPISTISELVTPHNPFVDDDTLYISYYEDGLKVYDLSNPLDPALIGYYDSYPDNGQNYTGYNGAWGCYPFLPSGNILVSDVTYGLNVIQTQTCPNPVHYYEDKDGDGFGNPNVSVFSCSVPGAYVLNNTDCDDNDSSSNPNAVELCDGMDNDCDGLVDLNDPDIQQDTFYLDADNDNFGDASVFVLDCIAPLGYVDNSEDCNDSNAMVNPDFIEICDGIDNDCDGLVDGDDADLASIEWYLDGDDDGFGNDQMVLFQCVPPVGYVAFPGDCNDNDATVYPMANEICDGVDNNCDSVIDEGCTGVPCDGVDLYINPVVGTDYNAKETITSDATVNVGQHVAFFAGSGIDLDGGFEIMPGTSFYAAIEDCDLNSNIREDNDDTLDHFIRRLRTHKPAEKSGRFYILKGKDIEGARFFSHHEDLIFHLDLSGAESHSKYKVYVFENGYLIDNYVNAK